MGGSITGGNVNGGAEFNIFCDPEAADDVFHAGWPFTMVGLDVTEVTLVHPPDADALEKSGGAQAKFAAGIARFQIGLYAKTGFSGGAIHDALAVGVAIDPTFVRTQFLHVDVETGGRYARGETVANRHGTVDHAVQQGDILVTNDVEILKPNIHVAVGVDSARFIQFFLFRLEGK
jgi:purine nucleosidase